MLQTVLPQAKECGDAVEVWVSDNASPDKTPDVVETARSLGPLNYSRNRENLGFCGNIVKLTTELARGEYVWLIGDDDLLLPDSLARVLTTLQANRRFDAFYANFQNAFGEKDWPNEAVGGYRGAFHKLNSPSTEDRQLQIWKETIRAESGLCGNMYAHIVRRNIWVDYWKNRRVPGPRSLSFLAVYPHTTMFADTLMDRPAYYIGQPVLTTFHGTQAFISFFDRVFALYLPRVLRYYQRRGLTGLQFQECIQELYTMARPSMVRLLQQPFIKRWSALLTALRTGWRYPAARRMLVQAVRISGQPRCIYRALSALKPLRKVLGASDLWADPRS